ncbi:protein of unknown function [Methylocaldum szegediense]|uniref:Transposase IS66 C-terminal domain-containing protein n=2 Tax=Methylocaldum szegediense TaxID=73780 RepID=A0ABM9I6N3_9GAMM|nr:protein of unknown function [Methylocaldum szegediense]
MVRRRPVLASIEALPVRHLHRVIPNSLLGEAEHYLSAQWPKLIRFADTVGGAKASANLYSLIETCKANCIDSYSYLADLFRKLPLAKPPITSRLSCPGISPKRRPAPFQSPTTWSHQADDVVRERLRNPVQRTGAAAE